MTLSVFRGAAQKNEGAEPSNTAMADCQAPVVANNTFICMFTSLRKQKYGCCCNVAAAAAAAVVAADAADLNFKSIYIFKCFKISEVYILNKHIHVAAAVAAAAATIVAAASAATLLVFLIFDG